MSGFLDCYVMAPERTAEVALAFLDRLLPDREPSFDPADPSQVLGIPLSSSLQGIPTFLENNPRRYYRMYWANAGRTEPHHAFLAFNKDGSLVLGLSTYDDETAADRYLAEMKAFAGTDAGFWAWEFPPPLSRREFEALAGK